MNKIYLIYTENYDGYVPGFWNALLKNSNLTSYNLFLYNNQENRPYIIDYHYEQLSRRLKKWNI